jgi:hypothetical protein
MNWDEYFNRHNAPKTITAESIKKIANVKSQVDLRDVIKQLRDSNYITPMGDKVTYQTPQVHAKYRVCKADNSSLLHEMNYDYHISLNFDYYKNHIEVYEDDKERIAQLSDYLKSGKLKRTNEMSINERSLDIFGNEKYLASETGESLISRLRIDISSLNIYRTPEPFFYYFNPEIKSINALIVENKDTWYTIRQLIREGKPVIGKYFCAVIYGEGRKIQSSFKGIDYDDYRLFNNPGHIFYYIGDIDSYGIDILVKLMKENDTYSVEPFLPAYQFLLANLDKKREKTDKEDRANLKKEDVENIFSDLTSDDVTTIYNVCSANYILPQEILNNNILRK